VSTIIRTIPQNDDNLVSVPQDKAPLDGEDTSSDATGEVAISSPFDTTKIRVESKPAIMDTLIKRMENNEIDMAPDFQRSSDVWSNDVQSRLIESLILCIPIPSFYFDATNRDKWIIVDGLQRLTAIDKFVIKKELALSGLEFLTDYNEKKFDDLPRNFKRNIEEADVNMYLIQEGTPTDVKFTLFKRINTGGSPLTPQEIRHALNQGPVTEFLAELSQLEEFKRATTEGIPAKRMDDRECITRFIAFKYLGPEAYGGEDFNKFLNNAMAALNKEGEDTFADLKRSFLRAMNASFDIFEKHAFRKQYKLDATRNPINKALFETWSVNLAKLSDAEIERLKERKTDLTSRFINLMNEDKDFEDAISQSTGSIKKVQYRFSKIAAIIEDTLNA
jgi:hypothetical protein